MWRNRRDANSTMICVTGCALLVLIQRTLDEPAGGILTSLVFLGTILVAGIQGGWRFGFAATALGILSAIFLFSPPYLVRVQSKPVEGLRLLSFVFLGSLLTTVGELLQQAWRRIEDRQRRLDEEVAERRRAQLAEQARADELMTTLTSIGDGVIKTDAEGRVTFLNPVAEQLVGCSTAQATGRLLTDVFGS